MIRAQFCGQRERELHTALQVALDERDILAELVGGFIALDPESLKYVLMNSEPGASCPWPDETITPTMQFRDPSTGKTIPAPHGWATDIKEFCGRCDYDCRNCPMIYEPIPRPKKGGLSHG
jgi:hypothetical protein